MKYNRNLVFIAACCGIFLFGISLITLGTILPKLAIEYNLTEINKGTLASILPIGILIGSLVFGPVVDKYAYKYLLAVSILLILIGMLIIAKAASFYQLGISFFLIGAGGGAINGATSSLVSDFSEEYGENKGANLSMMGAFFGLGALGTPLLLSLLSAFFSYKSIIAGIGLFMIFPLIFIMLTNYPVPKQAHNMSMGNIIKLLKEGALILFAFIMFFQSGWESLLNNWMTTYLIEDKAIDGDKALHFLTLFIAVFTIGRFLVGLLLKKFSAKKILIGSTLLALTGSLTATISYNEIMLAASLALTGLGLAATFPVVFGMIGDRYANWSGTAFGIALTIALLGNILINYITGILTEKYSFHTFSWILVCTGFCTTTLIIIGLSKRIND